MARVPAGRVVVALFDSVVPRTAGSFADLVSREEGGYRGTSFHRVINGFVVQGGERVTSKWGARWDDESLALAFEEPYVLGMANGGPNTNGAQFFFTVAPAPHLDHKHEVFGVVVQGWHVIDAVDAMGSESGVPKAEARIADCGLLEGATLDEFRDGE